MDPKKVEHCLDRAIDFLYRSQLPWGEFKTLASWNFLMIPAYYDSSPFGTGLILHNLKGLNDKRVSKMIDKAITFLLSEKEERGTWRFWTSRNKKRIPPDLDDISVISSGLKLYGVQFEDNKDIVLNNRNKEGLFLTWVLDERHKKNLFWKLAAEDADCVVNVNVLTYLGRSLPEVCSYINGLISEDRSSSYYYPSKLAFFYFVSRAVRFGVTCFKKNRKRIINSVLSCQKKDGSFGNEMETALGLNTLFNLNYFGKETEGGISYLLRGQRKNGGFKKQVYFLGIPWWFLALSPFYGYYGSEEITTGVCIEAFRNYLSQRQFYGEGV